MLGQGVGAGEVAVTFYISLLVFEVYQHRAPFGGLESVAETTYQAECSRMASRGCDFSYVREGHKHWHAFDLCGCNRSTRTSTVSVGSRCARCVGAAPTHPCCRGRQRRTHPIDK